MSISEAPTITGEQTELSAKAGDLIRLRAAIGGLPEPEVTWTKDGQPVEVKDRMSMSITDDQCSLVIKSCSTDDAGVYRATVRNQIGESSIDFTIKVQGSVLLNIKSVSCAPTLFGYVYSSVTLCFNFQLSMRFFALNHSASPGAINCRSTWGSRGITQSVKCE